MEEEFLNKLFASKVEQQSVVHLINGFCLFNKLAAPRKSNLPSPIL